MLTFPSLALRHGIAQKATLRLLAASRAAEVKRLPVGHLRHLCEWSPGLVVPEGAVPRVWLLWQPEVWDICNRTNDARDMLRLPCLASAGRRSVASPARGIAGQDRMTIFPRGISHARCSSTYRLL
jgi:hypothetical protein